MILKYDIICNESIDGLISEVNKKLKLGWLCQGGIGILTEGECYKVFYQAIIKESQNG